MARSAELTDIALPKFGLPSVEPIISEETYKARLAKLYRQAGAQGFHVMVIYADREHSANLAYLTGYDPRFEEALLICNIAKGSKPVLMVGNEGFGYTKLSPIRDLLEVILYQSFSLLGQPRDKLKPLAEILSAAGITTGIKVGVAGWKHYSAAELPDHTTMLEIPSFIADTLRDLAGGREQVINANAVLMDSSTGLRAINEVEQLARFEFAASFASQAVRNVIFGLEAGITEFAAVALMKQTGMPLSCHLMLSAGERAFVGLGSPSLRKIEVGDPFTTAYGVWGALNCRAGWVVEEAHQLPAGVGDYLEKLVKPYFAAIAEWYETIGIGVKGGELFAVIQKHLSDPFFGIGLNPGHLIHLDEWVHSPIYEGSNEILQTGMALQVDVIPATGTAYFTSNIEDGIALVDDAQRETFARQFPEAWERIQARRGFMEGTLGIRLKPEVLPFSNIPAYLPPFLLNPFRAMRMSG